ncbi:DsbA family protein [Tabrizicola sp.]|uniref:DsbA family protein n=1 Tax=Tabrizicola sp. TaxID=2005166 RepID=UPI00286AE4FB|nr:DsbA family protein [Tabrizicola sp.]
MRRLVLGLAAAVFSTAALAGGLGEMSPEERDAFRAEVRAYLLENPEVITEAMAVLEEREAAAAELRDAALVQANTDAIFKSPGDWVGGNPDGDVTVVEFMDYRCGYCRKAHEEVNALVKADGNIRYVIKEFPILGDGSMVSSKFAIAVRMLHGDDAYKAAHNALVALRGDPTAETLTRLAADLGHDPAPILEKMATEEVKAVILANYRLAETMDITGTPTFVIDGTMLRGYAPLDDMQKIVASERAG